MRLPRSDRKLLPAAVLLSLTVLFGLGAAVGVTPAREIRADHMVLSVAVSEDVLVAGTQSGLAQSWSWRTGQPGPDLLALHAREATGETTFPPSIRDVAVAPSGQYVAIASSDDRVRFRPLVADAELPSGFGGFPCLQLEFAEDSLLFTGDMRGDVAARDLRRGEEQWRHQLDYAPVADLALSPDGNTLAVCFSSSLIRLIDPATGETRRTLRGHRDSLFSLAWLDDETLISGSKDKRAFRWDISDPGSTPTVLWEGDSYVTALAAHPATKRVAVVLDEYSVGVFSPATSSAPRELRGHTAPVQAIRFLDRGRFLVTAGNDSRVLIWNLEEGNQP